MQSALVSTESLILRAVVAQYCNPAVGGQGHRDAHGLSAEDPHPSLWISVSTMPNDVETCTVRSQAWGPYMSVWGQQYL